jgi:hypothetical protein
MEFIKVRKKPVEVEAFQLTREILKEITSLSNSGISNVGITHINGRMFRAVFFPDAQYTETSMYGEVETLEGNMRANIGDWIIKGVNGEIYPCKPDIFEKTYEVVR